MTQRPKVSSLNLTELCATKSSKRGKATTASSSHYKRRSENSNNHLMKTVKQQNVPSPSSPVDFIQYSASENSPLVEVTVKHSNLAKSSAGGRESWGQLLKSQKVGGSESVFSNFDPLRTLHFLAKELQIHLQALLPRDKNVQEMITAMQGALKRVPPEVASTIHLQQAIELLPHAKRSASLYPLDYDVPERLAKPLVEKSVQTDIDTEEKKAIKESTMKLEENCKRLEYIGSQLNNDRIYLEGQLQNEKSNVEFYKKRLNDLENLNRELLEQSTKKDNDIVRLRYELETAKSAETIIEDLKRTKSESDQEIAKLKHQLRLLAVEKEKHLAVLAVRDRQIAEIRNEMTRLQEAVNDQLVEINGKALATMPGARNVEVNKENVGDGTISPVRDEDDVRENGLPSGDAEGGKQAKFGSQTSVNVRDLFGELKKQAYRLTTPPPTDL